MIARYGEAFLAYRCMGGCGKWHLTTHSKGGKRSRRWNNIDTPAQMLAYWQMVKESGYVPKA